MSRHRRRRARAPSVRTRRRIQRPVRRGQRHADPPLRRCNMKDSTGENEHNGRKRPDGDETLAELLSSYTPKQREAFLKGFRILAKVAVRAHMERQAPGFDAAPDDGGEEQG